MSVIEWSFAGGKICCQLNFIPNASYKVATYFWNKVQYLNLINLIFYIYLSNK